MAVTIAELIAQREKIKEKGKQKYQITTSIGDIVAILPDAAMVAEALDMPTSFESNKYIVYNAVVEPNLKDKDLQDAYGVFDAMDIVTAIFLPGEITKIGSKLLDFAGFKGKITAKVHEEVKN